MPKGGSGSGTVNSGNQYQGVVCANSGTAVSPDPKRNQYDDAVELNSTLLVCIPPDSSAMAAVLDSLTWAPTGLTFGLVAPSALSASYTWAAPTADAAGPIRASGSGSPDQIQRSGWSLATS